MTLFNPVTYSYQSLISDVKDYSRMSYDRQISYTKKFVVVT